MGWREVGSVGDPPVYSDQEWSLLGSLRGPQGPLGTQMQSWSKNGPLALYTGPHAWDLPRSVVVKSVRLNVGPTGAPTGAALIVDVLADGVSIFADPNDRPTILDGERRGAADLDPPVTIVADTEVTIRIVQVGSNDPGRDLSVLIEYE